MFVFGRNLFAAAFISSSNSFKLITQPIPKHLRFKVFALNAKHNDTNYHHRSVLLQEAVDVLNPLPGGVYIDCTLGGGGHTRLILERSGPDGKIYAFDRDAAAIENAKESLGEFLASGRLVLTHCPFSQIYTVMKNHKMIGKVDGVLADIGVSSHQLDTADRGFSFMSEGPLDMRMDQTSGQSAAEFIASATESEIADVIYKYGEETKSRFIAKIICERRERQPFETTLSLANLIAAKVHWKKESRKHPATKTFQALRIFVNQELLELETLLDDSCRVLRIGGILAVITFHSLEDRLVKTAMLRLSGKSPATDMPREIVLTSEELASYKNACAEIVRPFPASPTDSEIKDNPRARSAKLRAIRLLKECL